MPVTAVQQDLDNLTLTITADFAAPVERIWQVYADPRQLEKVWGPPTYPATVVDHGGRIGRRPPHLLQLTRVGVDLPDSLHRRGEVGGDGQGQVVEVLLDGGHGHGSVLLG